MFPVIGICGKAGVGKDTVAGMMAKAGGVCIAQADPMKRFAQDVFGFSLEQLWGPSEMRNAIDPRNTNGHWDVYLANLEARARPWVTDIGLGDGNIEALFWWFRHEKTYAQKNGLTPRHVLQTLGTEFGRKQRDSLWVDYAQNMALHLLRENKAYDRTAGAIHPMDKPTTAFVIVTDVRFRNEVLAIKRAGGKVIKVSGPNPVALEGDAGKHASETEQDGLPNAWFDMVLWNDKSKGFEVLQTTVDISVTTLLPPPLITTHFDKVAT